MANALISHNVDREPRQLVPRAANGCGEVSIIQYDTLETEAARTAELVGNLIDNRGYRPQDILILAQRRSVGNPIHDALTGRNIPSKSYYQEGMIDNIAAQERLAVLKLFIDSSDRIALRWLLGYGSDDFRKNAYARLRAHCEQNDAEPWDALAQLSAGQLRIPYTHPLVDRYRAISAELDGLRRHATLQEFIPAWLQDQIDENDPFHGLVLELSLTVETPDELLAAVIEAVSQPDIPPDVTEVRIMSLHKSKGLSSPVVIIASKGCCRPATIQT